jgi:hypothetical protein
MLTMPTNEIPVSRILELATNPRFDADKVAQALDADTGLYIMVEMPDVITPVQFLGAYVAQADGKPEVRVQFGLDSIIHDEPLYRFAEMADNA